MRLTASAPAPPVMPGGRLTLATDTPVLITDQTAKGTVYYALYLHDFVPVWNGVFWANNQITELSLVLDSDSGHTGYHQGGKLFDFFRAYVSGTYYFGTGPAWTDNSTRASALSRKNGILTNSGTMTLRHGSSSGNTVSVPANQGTFLGTMYCTADGQTEMVFKPAPAANPVAVLGLYNAYNQVDCRSMVRDGSSTWTYSSFDWRIANGSGNQIVVVCGLNGGIDARYMSALYPDVPTSEDFAGGQIGIGFDWSSGDPTVMGVNYLERVAGGAFTTTLAATMAACDIFMAAPGLHTITALEQSYSDTDAIRFYGRNWFDADGVPASALSVSLRM